MQLVSCAIYQKAIRDIDRVQLTPLASLYSSAIEVANNNEQPRQLETERYESTEGNEPDAKEKRRKDAKGSSA